MSDPGHNPNPPLPMTGYMDHLNDAQFSALLAGEATAETAAARAHVDACAACRAELDLVIGAMADLNALTLEWAERRAATLPPVRPGAQVWLRPVAWASATAVLALAIFAGVRHEQRVAESGPAIAASESAAGIAPQEPRTREQQIAEDNQMLLAIRSELTQPEKSLMVSAPDAEPQAVRRVAN